ncbi:MAG: lipoyl synthase [Gammaproteobacteria bacterium]|nr:lipoyl synthase [Gammaproteobacteria bacterium]
MSCTPINKPEKQRDFDKLSRIPIKIEATENADRMRLPKWLYTTLPKASEGSTISYIKKELRSKGLSSVCEEASCPNLPECFSKKTATFMVMGDLCTRRCSFCDVAHGKPKPLDGDEPRKLAESIQIMGLKYVVITSVDRDDLRDGGANHFASCIKETRALNPEIKIEILVPDFRGKNRMQIAIDVISANPPDVFNHNVETVQRLYAQARPGSDYQWSLSLLKNMKERLPHVPTKSGLMLGLGETNEEIEQVLVDLRAHNVDMLTIGQYLQPSKFHLPIQRYATPAEFKMLGDIAKKLGFKNVASGPNVRSSYHAEQQVEGDMIING